MTPIRGWMLGLLCLLPLAACASPGERPDPFQSPEALAAALYAPYLGDGSPVIADVLSADALPDAPAGYLHSGLAEAVDAFLALEAEDKLAPLDFDPLVDGQDFEITEFEVQPAEVSDTPSGRHAGMVAATFRNFGEPRDVWLGVERIDHARPWRLTAVMVRSGHQGRQYRLEFLLQDMVSEALAP